MKLISAAAIVLAIVLSSGGRTLPIRCAGAALHSDRPRRHPRG